MTGSAGSTRSEKKADSASKVVDAERAPRTAIREVTLHGGKPERREHEDEIALLRRELETLNQNFHRLETECRAQLARFERVLNQELDQNAVSRLRDHFTHFKRDVDHSLTHISFALAEYHRAITELKIRLERYVNIGPIRYVRDLRRRLFRL